MTTYSLKSVTIRVNNSRDGIGKIKELWKDIQNGKLPLLCDNTGVFIMEYIRYRVIPVMKVMRMGSMICP